MVELLNLPLEVPLPAPDVNKIQMLDLKSRFVSTRYSFIEPLCSCEFSRSNSNTEMIRFLSSAVGGQRELPHRARAASRVPTAAGPMLPNRITDWE
jgi:hypothetical protein